MNVLIINSGSSSLKFQLINMTGRTTLCKGLIERIGIDGILNFKVPGSEEVTTNLDIPDHNKALSIALSSITDAENGVVKDLSEINAVGHRIVQGGPGMNGPRLIDDNLITEIKKYTPLAPLHNPACLLGVQAAKNLLPAIPHVASFDTAYYGGMNEEDYVYGLEYSCYTKYGYRKFGYHGASHNYVNRRAKELLEAEGDDLRTISCHIGGGVTIAASIGGVGVDTSLGYGTVCGAPMGTRSGDVDPEVILQLISRDGFTTDEVKELIYKKSGLLGISGVSSDTRDILRTAEEGNERSQLALKIYSKAIRRYIAALSTSLRGRMDALIFTAGVGENSYPIRSMICSGLEVFGIKLDEEKNNG